MLLAALFVLACFFGTVRASIAAPALWLVQSPTGKVYLFGTVHIINNTVAWRSPELEAAIAQSQDLYLEIADANNTGEAASALFKLGLDRDHPLSTLLPKADIALLDEQARKYGMPGEAMFEPMRPWLAYLMLAALSATHSTAGSGSNSGVDLQIRKQFAEAGKPILGFETFDSQAHIFADLPQATQIALLESTLKTPQDQGAGFDALVSAWQSGDPDGLGRLMQLDAMEKSPIYAPLIGDRNRAWATLLAQRLKLPGTSFVAVGAAHLIGPNGVPALLQGMGLTVTRVQIADSSPGPSMPSAALPATPTPVPSATTSALPPPPKLRPPPGWQEHALSLKSGAFAVDDTWGDPKARGILLVGNLTMPAGGVLPRDLDAFDAFFHQGLVAAAGGGAVQPSKHVKICDGKRDGLYTTVTVGVEKEDIVIALSDRVYFAQYVRPSGNTDDPAAIQALLTFCPP
jgi:uncharacterized protein YbaP (TraB family)